MDARGEMVALGERLRRSAGGPLLTYLDATLPLLRGEVAGGCSVCAGRRVAKRDAQRKWRKKRVPK